MEINYNYFYKRNLKLEELSEIEEYDFFISINSTNERILKVYENIKSKNKIWINISEMSEIDDSNTYIYDKSFSENDNTFNFINKFKFNDFHKICIDITSFPIPFLFLLIKNLQINKIIKFDVIYTEPEIYNEKEDTKFSEDFIEVRQIEGFDGNHNISTPNNDMLIIAAGYEHARISEVCNKKEEAKKILLFGFPSLQPDFYQQNILKSNKASDELGNPNFTDIDTNIFAPANDPFVTAQVIKEFIINQKTKKNITNIYLTPLSTKAQALGIALYYIWECENKPVSIIYPFCNSSNVNTSTGLSNITLFKIVLPSL